MAHRAEDARLTDQLLQLLPAARACGRFRTQMISADTGMADRADLHELLDGAEEEMDFEPDDDPAPLPLAAAARQPSSAAKRSRCAAALPAPSSRREARACMSGGRLWPQKRHKPEAGPRHSHHTIAARQRRSNSSWQVPHRQAVPTAGRLAPAGRAADDASVHMI